MTAYPRPAQLHASIDPRTRNDTVTAECKRLIEERWRSVGEQVLVTIENGCIRSDLVDGMPAK